MRHPRHGLPIALLALAFLLPARGALAADFDSAAIDRLVGNALKAWDVPGAAVVIVDADSVLYLKGHGARELGNPAPVTPDTVFPLGSCGKAFTTAVMAQLVDRGIISWEDSVRRHLPYFHLSDPNADGLVTLRDLVTHRTGLAPYDLLWYRAPWSQEEMIRRAGRLPLTLPFRTAVQYQSVMFTAAGHAAARAAGRPWAELVQEQLFRPLGMKTATTRTPDALALPDHSAGHRLGRDGKVRVVPWYAMDKPNPAGSISASARDLAPWLQMHLNEGTYKGARLISAEQVRAMHSPQVVIRFDETTRAEHPETVQMTYGLGWVIQDYHGRLLVSHAGIIDGFRVHLTLLPGEKLGLAILANLHATRMNLSLSNQIVDHLLKLPTRDWDSLYKKVVADDQLERKLMLRQIDQARLPGTRPTLPLEAYTGTYEHEAYGTARVLQQDGRLVLEWSAFRCPLEHYQVDVFRPRGEELFELNLVEFATDNGAADAMRFLGMVFRRAQAKQ